MNHADCRQPSPTDRKKRCEHGIGAEMGDERPDGCQPDSRAEDRNETQAIASHDGVVPAQATNETIIEAGKSRGFGKLAERTAWPERLAECSRHRNVRGRDALPHYLADIVVDLADVDYVYPGFGGQIASPQRLGRHRRRRAGRNSERARPPTDRGRSAPRREPASKGAAPGRLPEEEPQRSAPVVGFAEHTRRARVSTERARTARSFHALGVA